MKKIYLLCLLATTFITNAQELLSTVTFQQPTCNQLGILTVSATGGIPPYTYSLEVNGNQLPTQVSNIFSGISSGRYTITTRDSANNEHIIDITVLTVQSPILSVSYGNSSDSVLLTGTGGAPPYLFSVDNAPYTSSNFFGGLSVGDHTISMIDANSCTVSLTHSVLAPGLSTPNITGTMVSCRGNADGIITVTPIGGLAPYIYRLNDGINSSSGVFSNLAGGNYTVSVIDSLGFVYTSLFTIPEPPSLIATTNIVGSNITINATGGTPPYEYSLNSGPFTTANVYSGLPVGIYSIQTRDINGCNFTLPGVINVAPPIVNNNQAATTVNFPTAGSTLADIPVQGNNVLWYATPGTSNSNRSKNKNRAALETPLPLTTVVQNNTTYYASQTINGFESQQRVAVQVTIGALSNNENAFNAFNYYPNPVKNSFVVANNTYEIQQVNVVDLSGKTLISRTINDFKSEIDFSNLNSGMYFVKIKANEIEKTFKVVKE